MLFPNKSYPSFPRKPSLLLASAKNLSERLMYQFDVIIHLIHLFFRLTPRNGIYFLNGILMRRVCHLILPTEHTVCFYSVKIIYHSLIRNKGPRSTLFHFPGLISKFSKRYVFFKNRKNKDKIIVVKLINVLVKTNTQRNNNFNSKINQVVYSHLE